MLAETDQCKNLYYPHISGLLKVIQLIISSRSSNRSSTISVSISMIIITPTKEVM